MEDVAIVLGRCGQDRRLFGVRFLAERIGSWMGVWGFDVLEQQAKREQWGDTQIEGQFSFADDYPGCPYCAGRSLVKCACGRITCWSGRTKTFTCAWCGSSGRLGGVVTSLSAGQDS